MSTFAQMKNGYAAMWKSCVVDATHEASLKGTASTILSRKADYVAAESATGVPWFMIAALHYRESNLNFRTYLGNGDPLNHVSIHVPEGRGPFSTWAEGAIDALKYQGFTKIKSWSIEQILFSAEEFNGTGYELHHENSPYVWAGTNHQQPGKYQSDGVYNPTMWDTQMGVAAVIKTLAGLDSSIKLENVESTTMTTPATTPASGFATAMLELDKITKVLETVVGYVPVVAPFFPPLQVIVPFLPVVSALLAFLDKLESAGGDPSVMFKAAEAAIPDIIAKFKAAQAHPTVVAAVNAQAAIIAQQAPTPGL